MPKMPKSLQLEKATSRDAMLMALERNNTTLESIYKLIRNDVVWSAEQRHQAIQTNPGYLHLKSLDGTDYYLFVEDDGTLKIHTAVPTQNSDGSEIGTQT